MAKRKHTHTGSHTNAASPHPHTEAQAGTTHGTQPAPPFNAGVTTKDSRYLQRIKDATADMPQHPRHHGVKMQAHHVISATGMHASGLAEQIRKFGYNINELENLAFIPCTLQGACHLGVQPHRGNHAAPADPDSYANDAQPLSYHSAIAKRLLDLKLGLTKDCPGYMGGAQEAMARHKVKKMLDVLSNEVLWDIQSNPRKAPLTAIAAHFLPGNPTGCAGSDSTTTHQSSHHCRVDRNHQNQQGPGQKSENISFKSDGRYQLALGK